MPTYPLIRAGVSIYPLIVAVVSLAFGVIVLSQWMARRRPQQLIWGIALLMAAYLGMGSLYLALSKRVADLILAALVIVSAFGVALVLVAPVDVVALHRLQHTSGAGTGVLKPGPWLLWLIAVLNSFGAAAVIGVALYSAYKVLRRQAPVRFAVANVTIAIGTGIVTYAGTAARLGSPNDFWILMAVGWVVIFAGFLLTLKLAPLARPGRDVPMAAAQ